MPPSVLFLLGALGVGAPAPVASASLADALGPSRELRVHLPVRLGLRASDYLGDATTVTFVPSIWVPVFKGFSVGAALPMGRYDGSLFIGETAWEPEDSTVERVDRQQGFLGNARISAAFASDDAQPRSGWRWLGAAGIDIYLPTQTYPQDCCQGHRDAVDLHPREIYLFAPNTFSARFRGMGGIGWGPATFSLEGGLAYMDGRDDGVGPVIDWAMRLEVALGDSVVPWVQLEGTGESSETFPIGLAGSVLAELHESRQRRAVRGGARFWLGALGLSPSVGRDLELDLTTFELDLTVELDPLGG